MAGVLERGVDAGRNVQPRRVGDVIAEVVERMQGVVERVQRLRRAVAGTLAALCPLGLFLLQSGRIEQHDARQLAGGGGGVDAAAKPLAHELGNASAVVQVRMREQQRVDAGRVEIERFGVGVLDITLTLEQTAIDQHARVLAGD